MITPIETRYFFKWMDAPVGPLKLVGSDAALMAVLWEKDKAGRVPFPVLEEASELPVLVEAARQLSDYFAGKRREFTVVRQFRGTEFQRSVWEALDRIPFGETRTYSGIAREIGRPAAVRAVGTAIGRNPISIIVPCHRVIGQNGTLTGFAGGLRVKQFLLELEHPGGG